MKLPVRKCYHAAKVGFFIILVLAILTLFEQWRGGKRSAKAQSSDEDDVYEREILEDEARIIPGLGEGGVAAYLTGEAKRLGEESEKKLAINVYLSDRISYNRTLKDHRNPACDRVVYDAELPSASVILIFHNEPYSVVVRTIWSVVNSARRDQPWYRKANYIDRETGRTMHLGYPGQDPSSPLVYLKEIILVDDNSTLPELKGKLSHYVRTRLPPGLIRILRLPDRVGITRARFAGSQAACGDVLIFLDAHCEAGCDWLRPLLQRIRDKRSAVLTPIIDMIEHNTLEYYVGNSVEFEGLMLARIAGARAARGAVLVFLDAHCEAGRDWLRPLLQRVRDKRDAVVTPLIDVVDQTTFQLDAAQHFQVGGFTFMGHFTWIDVPEREKKRRGSDIAPTWSPTMAGGLFAIERAYFWEIGAYDEQMAGWGGENLEMSFRVWQCGGTLETIPCSRVGHVFRSFHPYGLPAHTDTHGINTARMAEVWMDDYAELFYLHRPDLRKNPKIGDVTHRRVLREKLQCKSFQWYLDNVYKEKFVPVRDVYGFGRFMNPSSGLCLDTLQREGEAQPLGVYGCHARLEATQYLALSLRGELRDEEKCAEVQYTRNPAGEVGEEVGRRVLMVTCHGKQRGQKWRYLPTQQLQHVESALCLAAPAAAGSDATVATCRNSPRQIWRIDYSELNDFRMKNDAEITEQEMRLQKLRGQRRVSRSLLSYSQETNSTRRKHHHKGKSRKKKTRSKKRKHKKDKFILKLVRAAANNTEEHLEVDIYCRHTRLYPNNSFVRDLVTVLNDRDIKVINNGRVFEHHRVSELVRPSPATPAGEWSPAPPTTHSEPLQPKPQKKRKNKKSGKLQPLTKPTSIDRVHPIDGDTIDTIDRIDSVDRIDADGIDRADRIDAIDKKIIIEDFVEVKPSTPSTQRPLKKRKRKHGRARAPPAPAPPTEGERERVREGEKEREREGEGSSLEDAPLLSERASDEHWPLGESRFRRTNTHGAVRMDDQRHGAVREHDELHGAVRSRDQLHEYDSALPTKELDNQLDADEEAGKRRAVKLVMKTNLTFNLGDEFFRWRPRSADDVANLLGELIIPANTTKDKETTSEESDVTHTHTDRDVPEREIAESETDRELHSPLEKESAAKRGGRDDLLTGRGRSKVTQYDSSGTSESGED